MKCIVQITYLLRKNLINNHYKCCTHVSLFSDVISPFQWIPRFRSLRVRYSDSLAWWPLRGGLGKWCCGCSSVQFLHFFFTLLNRIFFLMLFSFVLNFTLHLLFHSLVNTKTDLTGLHPLNEQWLTVEISVFIQSEASDIILCYTFLHCVFILESWKSYVEST